MEVVKGIGDGCQEVLCNFVRNLAEYPHYFFQLPTDDVLKEQVVVVVISLGFVVPTDVVTAQTCHDILLPSDDMLIQHYLTLLDLLVVGLYRCLTRAVHLQITRTADHLIGLKTAATLTYVWNTVIADGTTLYLPLVDLHDEFITEFHVLHDQNSRIVTRHQSFGEFAEVAKG